MIFHDTTLMALAELKPDSMKALGMISGIGEAKLTRYGSQFLAVIAEG